MTASEHTDTRVESRSAGKSMTLRSLHLPSRERVFLWRLSSMVSKVVKSDAFLLTSINQIQNNFCKLKKRLVSWKISFSSIVLHSQISCFSSLLFVSSLSPLSLFTLSLHSLLSLSDEPSHESRTANTSKQTKTMHTLHCQQQRRLSSKSLCDSRTQRSQVCVLCRQQHSFQLGSPSSDSMRAALSSCRRHSHQITQQLGALAAPSSINLEDQRSHGHSIALRFLRFPSHCSHPWFLTHFRCNVRAGIAR